MISPVGTFMDENPRVVAKAGVGIEDQWLMSLRSVSYGQEIGRRLLDE